LFVDLSGYTALTDIHGSYTAFKTIEVFQEIALKSLVGKTVIRERIGDELLITSPEPTDLLTTVLKLRRIAEQTSEFLKIKASLHYGELLVSNDKLFGAALNLASRIISIAKSSQIVTSQDFVDLLPKSEKVLFEKIDSCKFKNVGESIAIFKLRDSYFTNDSMNVVDPVCKMILISNNEMLEQEHLGNRYFFCSQKCEKLFVQNPYLFINVSQDL